MKIQTQLWPTSLKKDSGTAKAWATLNPQSMEAAGVAGVVRQYRNAAIHRGWKGKEAGKGVVLMEPAWSLTLLSLPCSLCVGWVVVNLSSVILGTGCSGSEASVPFGPPSPKPCLLFLVQ